MQSLLETNIIKDLYAYLDKLCDFLPDYSFKFLKRNLLTVRDILNQLVDFILRMDNCYQNKNLKAIYNKIDKILIKKKVPLDSECFDLINSLLLESGEIIDTLESLQNKKKGLVL